jgi:hypothetical protein
MRSLRKRKPTRGGVQFRRVAKVRFRRFLSVTISGYIVNAGEA